MIPKRTLEAVLEVSTGTMIISSRPPAFTGEAQALAVSITMLNDGEAYTPTGNILAQMYLYWPGTVIMTETADLTIDGSVLSGSMSETMMTMAGCPLLVVQLVDADSGDKIVATATPIQITNVLGESVISTRPPTPAEVVYIGRSPYINALTGTWMQWDTQASAYVDTEVAAKGEKGDPGDPSIVMTGATETTDGAIGAVPLPHAGDQDKYLRGDGSWASAGTVMTGATATTPGTSGAVPAPAAGDQGKYLKGDGTWSTISDHDDTKADKTMVSGVESSTTSAAAYSAGDYLIVGQTLYRATAAIAIGDTIAAGTNVSAVTIGEELSSQSTRIVNLEDRVDDLQIVDYDPTTEALVFRSSDVVTYDASDESITINI